MASIAATMSGTNARPRLSFAALRDELRFRLDMTRATAEGARFLLNPDDTERLFRVIELSERHRHRYAAEADVILQRVRRDAAYAEQERERYMPAKPDLDVLASLPAGTLGHAFADHMRRNDLDVDFYPDVAITDDAMYLSQRLRMSHDIWHVVLDCDTQLPGEVAVQAFGYAQIGLPLAAMICGGGLTHMAMFKRHLLADGMRELIRGYRIGSAAKPFVAFPFEDRWATSLVDVRKELNVTL